MNSAEHFILSQINTEKWRCNRCTFENDLKNRKCEICDFDYVKNHSEARNILNFNNNASSSSQSQKDNSNVASDTLYQNGVLQNKDDSNSAIVSPISCISGDRDILVSPLPSVPITTSITPLRLSRSHPSTPTSTTAPSSAMSHWSCARCTLYNIPTSTSCAACKAFRPGKWICKTCTFENADSDVMSRANNKCTICGAERSETPLPLPPRSSESSQWTCGSCMYRNCVTRVSCEVCGKSNDLAIASGILDPPPPTPARQESELVEDLRKIEEADAEHTWQSILLFCQQNGEPYTDSEFPPTMRSIGNLAAVQRDIAGPLVIQWLRPPKIHPRDRTHWMNPWKVYRTPDASDICQGVLGNCWFLSALAVLVERPDLLEKIVITRQPCAEGVYQLRLCIDGMWRVVIVDDLFPCDAYGRLVFSEGRRRQLWVPLIEKGLAKLIGSYAALVAGHISEGLTMLTGYPSELIEIKPKNGEQDEYDHNWATLLSAREARFPMGACCGSGSQRLPEQEFDKVGLHSAHAYSILEVRWVDQFRLLRLRNPWGRRAWNGDWSDHSPKWSEVSPQTKQELMPVASLDGVFWIEYSDFCRYFSSVDICHAHNNNWSELRSRGRLPPHCLPDHLQLSVLTVLEPTDIEITLHQQSSRSEGVTKHGGLLDLCVIVCELQREHFERGYQAAGKYVCASNRALRPFVSVQKFLDPGQYYIMGAAFNHFGLNLKGHETPGSMLAVHSAKRVVLEAQKANSSLLASMLMRCALKLGRKEPQVTSPFVKIYTLIRKWSGMVLVVENHYTDMWVQVKTDCVESENIVSTRGVLTTLDSVPPLHRQIVQIITQLEAGQQYILHYSITRRDVHYDHLGADWCPRNPKARHWPPIDIHIHGLHAALPLASDDFKN